ncbi:MAG: DUF5666 domain-containing protein [Armatimonas sp.]
MLRRCLSAFAFLLLLAFFLGGCGGGGSDSPAPSNRQVDVFVTDGFSDDYAQVWVTLYKIEAGKGGTFTTVYESTEGKTINLAALKDAKQFLNSVSLPDVAYDTLRLSFGDTFTLVPPGGGAGVETPVEARENLTVADGKAVLTLHDATRNLLEKGNRSLVMDFDLAAFTLVGGKVRPQVKPDAPVDFESREPIAELTGTVSELQPGREFRLQLPGPNGARIRILLNGDTKVYGADGQDATLANGQTVFVRGTRGADQSVTAITIRILGGEPHRLQTYWGTVAEINEANASFTIVVREGTAPLARERLIVLTNAQTVFRKLAATPGSSTAAAFSDLRVGQKVSVTGELDGDRLRLTATRVEIQEREIPPILETMKGTVREVGGDRFVLEIAEASPISLGVGLRLIVTVNAATTYRKAGNPASYADIKVGAVVRATGVLNADKTQLAASAVEILQEAPPPPAAPTTLTGAIAERNEATHTLVVTVRESSVPLPNERTRVVLSSSTILLKPGATAGELVTATWADFTVGRSVQAIGTLSADKTQLAADKVTLLRL